MLKLNNKPLSYDRAFTHADIQYPANWLRLSSLEERNALGITEVADAPSYDQRFYWGCLLYTSPSPRDRTRSRMPSSA